MNRIFALLSMMFITTLFLASLASASVEVYPERDGSRMYVVTLDNETMVDDVASGDYLTFRFAQEEYFRPYNHEDLTFRLRRVASESVEYDLPGDSLNTLGVGESVVLDVDADGVDDVSITLEESGRRAVFQVMPQGLAEPEPEPAPEPVVNESEQEVVNETLEPENETVPEPEPEPAPEPVVNESEEEQGSQEPAEEKGWFMRVLEWFATLV